MTNLTHRHIIIDAAYHAVDAETHCLTALYPCTGPGSLEAVIAEYGDDIDVILQSAAYYLIAEDGAYYALETPSGVPCIGSCAGIFPVAAGYRYEDPNGDGLTATAEGWKPADTEIDTYGEKI
jgi:hypothetical protein